jgi:hypothetical protein
MPVKSSILRSPQWLTEREKTRDKAKSSDDSRWKRFSDEPPSHITAVHPNILSILPLRPIPRLLRFSGTLTTLSYAHHENV